MDDWLGGRTDVAVRMDVSHHIMTQSLFMPGGGLKIDVVDLGLQFVNLSLRDIQPEFALGLGQNNPQFSPSRMFGLRRPELTHLGRSISADQRIVVNIVIQNTLPFQTSVCDPRSGRVFSFQNWPTE